MHLICNQAAVFSDKRNNGKSSLAFYCYGDARPYQHATVPARAADGSVNNCQQETAIPIRHHPDFGRSKKDMLVSAHRRIKPLPLLWLRQTLGRVRLKGVYESDTTGAQRISRILVHLLNIVKRLKKTHIRSSITTITGESAPPLSPTTGAVVTTDATGVASASVERSLEPPALVASTR